MCNQYSRYKRRYLATCISLLLTFQTTEAAWLKAYGTAGEESATDIVKLDTGGYAITGRTDTTNWYGLLDEQGKVAWSKSSGNAQVSIKKDGSVDINEIKNISPESGDIKIEASGKLDVNTGAISDIAVKKSKKISGTGGELRNIDGADNAFQGRWNSANTNYDVAFAKFDTNNQLLWSHLYDVGGGSDYGSIYPLKTAYLLSLKNSVLDRATGTFVSTHILTKLDKDGTILPESTQKIDVASGVSFIYPVTLDDGSIVLTLYSASSKDISLIKLDGDLHYVWGKRFYSTDGADRLLSLGINEVGSNELEISVYRQHLDDSSTQTEAHPLSIKIDASTGAVLSKKEIRMRQFDPPTLLRNTTGNYSLSGSISDTGVQTNDDGLFAQFNSALQPERVKAITGSAFDTVYHADNIPESTDYLLSGATTSWGAGNTDALLGKLDGNATVANCAAIQDVNANIVDANIAEEAIPNPLTPAADPVDKGPFTVSVDEQQYSLDLNPVDYPITATDICSADNVEPKPTGTISLSSSALDFGNVALTQTARKDINVDNSGNSALNITGITPPPAPFSITGDSCTGTTLPANGSCTLIYQFAPTVPGSFSIPLTVTSNGTANSTATFTLKGTGTGVSSQPDPGTQALSGTDFGAGSKVTITGNFSNKKGKVKVGNKIARIVSWKKNSIVIKLPAVKAGTYPINVYNRKVKTPDNVGQLSVHVPEISTLDTNSGSKNTPVTVNGQYLGTGIKPKVYLASSTGKRTAVKVSKGNTDTTLKIKIPRLQPADYRVIVKNSAGESSSQVSFTFK